MFFRDDFQACKALRILLGSAFADVDKVWSRAGPTLLAACASGEDAVDKWIQKRRQLELLK